MPTNLSDSERQQRADVARELADGEDGFLFG
jgi:hypothetical protein